MASNSTRKLRCTLLSLHDLKTRLQRLAVRKLQQLPTSVIRIHTARLVHCASDKGCGERLEANAAVLTCQLAGRLCDCARQKTKDKRQKIAACMASWTARFGGTVVHC